MTTRTITADVLPLVTKLQDLLFREEDDGVKQQMAIEILLVWHAYRVASGNRITACHVADSMNKHAKQIITENIFMLTDGDHRA